MHNDYFYNIICKIKYLFLNELLYSVKWENVHLNKNYIKSKCITFSEHEKAERKFKYFIKKLHSDEII